MRVAILEDSVLLRSGLAAALRAADVDVVLETGSSDELLAGFENARPDVVLLDIRLPPDYSDEGIVIAERLRAQDPKVGLLVLSVVAESAYAMRLLDGGSSGVGYLLKDSLLDIPSLVSALTRVMAGECVIEPTLIDGLIKKRRSIQSAHGLTEREAEVLRLLAEGFSNAGIAERTGLSRKTVEVHLVNIFGKLRIPTDADINRRVTAAMTWLRSTDS
ncbi:MAG TPA: response regulator transcription factor [Candidatus Limnocylindrales bacterium]|nr:response regulator transcription factor [Candidatus Limnocylindrales bacterium]